MPQKKSSRRPDQPGSRGRSAARATDRPAGVDLVEQAPATTPVSGSFAELGLAEPLLQALTALGYETPTPIQARTIPPLLDGKDLLGHAPTGTGKTAAFALPILSRLKPDVRGVQVLVLTPTRELAIQVAEAFTRYAAKLPQFRILPIYGGQDYGIQLRQLNKGVQVVVGTPGRVMDHIRRGTMKLDCLEALVLDEADEMLRMGFIDDVEWVIEQIPGARQMALFSATMPKEIRRIASRHLNSPESITIDGRMTTADTIRQRFWMVSHLHKLDALTRILEAEPFDAMLIFVRTRTATVDLAERLTARGFAADAMNGDMPQKQREHMVEKLRNGKLDILVATDVVARGLDVNRISHVLNYDIPYDTEAYVHRIGRTGRAGRQGDAILFVTPRERRLLGAIEHATRQKLQPLELPSVEMVNNRRIEKFKQRITDTLAMGELAWLERLVEEYSRENNVPESRVAAALAKLTLGDKPLLIRAEHTGNRKNKERKPHRGQSDGRATDSANVSRPVPARAEPEQKTKAPNINKPSTDQHIEANSHPPARPPRSKRNNTQDTETFRVEVGKEHGVAASNIVGAIANEAGLDAEFIGKVAVHDAHSLVELPVGMPKFIMKDLKRTWVCGQRLAISRVDGKPTAGASGSDAQSTPDARGKADTRGESGTRGKSDARGESGTRGKSDARGKSDVRGESDARRKQDSGKKRHKKKSGSRKREKLKAGGA